MMLGGKLGRQARLVLREKNEDGLAVEASLLRMFCPDFEGKIEIVKCGPDEEGWNETILSNFRVPNEAALESVLPEGKGGSLGTCGATAGTKPVDDKKRKGDTAVACGEKPPKFRKTRATAVPKHKPAGSAEPLEEPVPMSTTPSSPSKVVDAEVQKKGGEDPSIEVVSSEGTPPAVHVE
ncbi:hypothetical protein HanHA300_Chr06g0218471 [Helianthus annuus]|nr:hypothetical protein HanHA300_Chr06g0218471 [Helianthus annuus]KAJ0916048.1 hypothetical protein HanPSC8_Chr06g0257091 [Helianthus annuus]